MPTMMLLIGMKMSFTKKPMNPMMKKPTDVAWAIFENSAQRGGAARVRGQPDARKGAGSEGGRCWQSPGQMRPAHRGGRLWQWAAMAEARAHQFCRAWCSASSGASCRG